MWPTIWLRPDWLTSVIHRHSAVPATFITSSDVSAASILKLLIKMPAMATFYRGHHRTLCCLPGIISLLIVCIGITTTTKTVLWPLFRDQPGELVPEENFWTLWCKGRLTEADTPTTWLGGTPSVHGNYFHIVTFSWRALPGHGSRHGLNSGPWLLRTSPSTAHGAQVIRPLDYTGKHLIHILADSKCWNIDLWGLSEVIPVIVWQGRNVSVILMQNPVTAHKLTIHMAHFIHK